MKYFLSLLLSIALISCNNTNNNFTPTSTVSAKNSINQIENNVKTMLTILKKDYPDGKNKAMDSTKKVFERRIAELDSLKNKD